MVGKRHRGFVLSGAALCALQLALPVPAQRANPVSFTVVRDHEVQRFIELPGSVESRRSSVVASEVAGLVVALEVREGDRVKRGQSLARLRTTDIELRLGAARGRLKEAGARLELARSKLERGTELFDHDVISPDELDDAFSEFTAWQGAVDESTAEVQRLQVALDRCVIRAPFQGVVVRELTEVGQWLDLGGEVVELISLTELEVRVEVPERHYVGLRLGAKASVRFEALEGHVAAGRISALIPRADEAARSFPIKIALSDPDPRIGVGMLAQVSIAAGETYRALVLPKDALVRQGGREIVFRITADDTVESVAVESGQGLGPWIVVAGELSDGERVVTRGNERLRPGQTVEATPREYPAP